MWIEVVGLATVVGLVGGGWAVVRAAQARAFRRQQQLVAHTAHELRTPIACVTTALAMVRDGYATDADEVHEFIEQAAAAAQHLGFVVDDVLDSTALAHGRLRFRPADHDVRTLFADAERLLAVLARTRDLRLAFTAPAGLRVHADARRLHQVLFNLVGNALKWSRAGGQVTVTAERRGDRVHIAVADQGPGVPPDAVPELFTRFGATASDPRVAPPGTGLGLFLSRCLVEGQGGRIGHHPGPTAGAVFWFELPLGHTIPRDSPIAEPPALHR